MDDVAHLIDIANLSTKPLYCGADITQHNIRVTRIVDECSCSGCVHALDWLAQQRANANRPDSPLVVELLKLKQECKDKPLFFIDGRQWMTVQRCVDIVKRHENEVKLPTPCLFTPEQVAQMVDEDCVEILRQIDHPMSQAERVSIMRGVLNARACGLRAGHIWSARP